MAKRAGALSGDEARWFIVLGMILSASGSVILLATGVAGLGLIVMGIVLLMVGIYQWSRNR